MTTLSMIALLMFGLMLGYLLRKYQMLAQKSTAEFTAQEVRITAESDAQQIVKEAQIRADSIMSEAREFEEKRAKEAKEVADRLAKKESFLDNRQLDIDRELDSAKEKITELGILKERAESALQARTVELERVAGLSSDEAKQELIATVESQYAEDLQKQLYKLEEFNREKLEIRARDIIATAIQRLATSTASDLTTTAVAIPSDDIKGKIIGKEGRNIKTFERAAGVELIVDDTPGNIII
jgi:ribonucrease Y